MNNLFYIKNITDTTSDYKNYFKINCPEKQYMDDMNEDISIIKTLNDNAPCYSQIYSGQPYKVDLTQPSIACDPPSIPSTSKTYRTYKFEFKSNTQMYISRQSQINDNYTVRLQQYNSDGDSIGSYRSYDVIQGAQSYNNILFETFPSPGVYYVTIGQYYTYQQFTSNEIIFTFDDAGTAPVESGLKKYKNLFTDNKKFQIIYKNEKFDFNYKTDYEEVANGQYKINSLLFKTPDNLPLTNDTLYPIIFDENENNTELNVNENDVDNTANIGLFNENDNIELNDYKFTLSYKNKHTTQNYKLLKDLLFTTSDTTANLKCNIYYDSTVLFQNVIIGNIEQVNLNLYLLASYDVSRIYYELQYNNNNCNIGKNIIMDYFDNDTNIPIINMKIADIIQGSEDQNCIIFDKYLGVDNDNFDILNIKQVYKKHYDLLDHNELFKNKKVVTEKTLNYNQIGYNDTFLYDHVFSEHGQYNKINNNIYSLVQFINNDATDSLYNKTLFIELDCIDGTAYSIVNEISIPINITDTTVNDAVYYGDKTQYIELLKNDKVFSLFIDLINDKVFYQGNLNYVTTATGLKYYPIKSIKDDSLYLTRTGINEIGNNNYKIIYNYKAITDSFLSKYNENLLDDVQRPYKNIYLSDDKSYLFIELNEDLCVYNLNNKSIIDLSNNNYYLNYNDSVNYYNKIGEIVKIGNEFISLSSIDSDNIIAENNQKLVEDRYEPIVSYDYIDIKWLDSIKLLENNISDDKEVIILATQKSNYLNNYPKDIVLYKDELETKFSFSENVLNFNIDMINEYYKIKRFIMKNKTTKLNYIHHLV